MRFVHTSEIASSGPSWGSAHRPAARCQTSRTQHPPAGIDDHHRPTNSPGVGAEPSDVVNVPIGHLGPSSDHDDEELELAVIVPCHNEATTLPEQLDRLVAERWDQPWSIVVVDNNSADATADVARSYAAQGVSVVSANAGRGVGYARNAGARAVRSRNVAFCDGDDVIQPGWVPTIGNALQHHDLVSGELDTTALNSEDLAKSRPMGRPGQMPRFGSTPFASGGNCGISRRLFEMLDGFDEHFDGLEDIEFSLRARAEGYSAVRAEGAVLAYRMRPTARDTWSQGVFYGGSVPLLTRRARDLGLPAPSHVRGLKSWAWLVLHMPRLRTQAGRMQLLWVFASRIGTLRRAIQLRSFYL